MLVAAGRAIYEQGRLPDGSALRATREGGLEATGPASACIHCHRRSGMGASEGQITIPPVVGAALFGDFRPAVAGHRPRHAPGVAFRDFPHRARPPYTVSALAAALRSGIGPDGRPFHFLMPRYALDDAALAALVAYLRQLPVGPAPGVEPDAIHLATVIAPDADPAATRGMLAVLQACIDERQPRGPGLRWRLHEWRLAGAPAQWPQQMAERQAQRPVFALVAGSAGDDWRPVHQGCEALGLPCLFPHTPLPGAPAGGVYSVYATAGVRAEADAIAGRLRAAHAARPLRRVVQVVGAGYTAAAAAQRLAAALPPEVAQEQRKLTDGRSAARALAGLGEHDALLLWLRPAELQRLLAGRRPPTANVFVSGLLGGLERAPLPAAWRRVALLTYPVEAPGRWELRARYNLRPWLQERGLKPGDERLQGETLAACRALAEGIYRLRGVFVRDYLLETVEAAVSGMGNAGATAPYPRFVLGANQRIASEGTYLVRFRDAQGTRLALIDDWVVP